MVIQITSSALYLTITFNTLAAAAGFSETNLRTNTITQMSSSNDGTYIQVWISDGRNYLISTLAVWSTLTAAEKATYYPIEELNASTYATNALLLAALKPIIFV